MNYFKKTYPDSKCYMIINNTNINNIDLYSFKDLYVLYALYTSFCNNITDFSMF